MTMPDPHDAAARERRPRFHGAPENGREFTRAELLDNARATADGEEWTAYRVVAGSQWPDQRALAADYVKLHAELAAALRARGEQANSSSTPPAESSSTPSQRS